MVFVIFWLICGAIAATIVSSKGGNAIIGFLVGSLLGPLGIVIAFFLGDEKQAMQAQIASGDRKKCPRCAELVQPEALVCKHCGHEFQSVDAV